MSIGVGSTANASVVTILNLTNLTNFWNSYVRWLRLCTEPTARARNNGCGRQRRVIVLKHISANSATETTIGEFGSYFFLTSIGPYSLWCLGILASALIPVVAAVGTIELHNMRCILARFGLSGHPAMNAKGSSSNLHVPFVNLRIHFCIRHMSYVLARCKVLIDRHIPLPTAIFLREQVIYGICSAGHHPVYSLFTYS
jgi:hypothetical protein